MSETHSMDAEPNETSRQQAVVRRGEWYRIRKRYDNGGSTYMHVLRVNRRSVRVQHCRVDKTPWPPQFTSSSNIECVKFDDWMKRMKYWVITR